MTPREKHEKEGHFALKQNPGPGMCLVKGCRKSAQPGKTGLCHCHHQYRWRLNSPKKSAYTTLRDHAKARGLAFTISYDYFLGVTDALAYWTGEGVPTIDRVDATRGYEPGNLSVISLSENTAKGNRERRLPAFVQSILERKRARVQEAPPIDPWYNEERDPF